MNLGNINEKPNARVGVERGEGREGVEEGKEKEEGKEIEGVRREGK